MLLVDEKIGATVEDDELLLVLCRLVGGAVGGPPILFVEDIDKKVTGKRGGLQPRPRTGVN